MKDLSNENILHIKEKDLEYIQFKKLLEFDELVHAFTLSTHNFDIGGNDTFQRNKETYINNYKVLANKLKIDYNNIIRPYQTHTDNIKILKNDVNEMCIFPEELKNVDGLITANSNVMLSLGFADCTPLYFYDPIKRIVANIHSGWRGTLQKIGQKTAKMMIQELGSKPENIICCIGPTIRKDHFEVKSDVEMLFNKEFNYTGEINKIISKNLESNSYYIDTVLINKLILKEVGLLDKNIIDSNICTACNSDIIHSYRIDKELSGRNTAIIGLRS